MSGSKRASLVFIAITLFLDVVGFGLIIPVLPRLVAGFIGGDPSRGAAYFGALSASFAAMQFVFAPVLGGLSDRFGRRPVLLASLSGFGASYLLMGFAPTLAWLFVARVMAGVTGASFTTAQAYIADISDVKTRAQNFGVAGAVIGLGFITGPALGGVLGRIGPRVPFFASAAVVGANLLYGVFVLPESLPRDRRRPFSLARANPLGGLLGLGRYPVVARLAAAYVLISLAQRGMESVFVLYTQYRFGWQELHNGLAMGLAGVVTVVAQGLLLRRIVRRMGERRTAIIGLVVATAGLVCYGVAWAGPLMLGAIVVAGLGGIASPAIQGLVSGSVAPNEQGGVQGTLVSLTSLTAIIAPLVSSQVFRHCSGAHPVLNLPGAPFFLGSLFFLGALAVVARAFAPTPPVAPPAAPT